VQSAGYITNTGCNPVKQEQIMSDFRPVDFSKHALNGKRTLEGWSYLVRCSVMRVTQYQADTIGKMCFEAEAKGENCSVWHQSAIYFRDGNGCNCVQCHPVKGAFKYHHVV
jgi:hypothetical protein